MFRGQGNMSGRGGRRPNRGSGTAPLLEPPEGGEGDGGAVNYRYKYYTLPGLRYTRVVKAMLFVDGIFSLILWLTGGNSQYFTDNILDFHFKESVFDLALLTSVQVIVLFALYTSLEDATLAQVNDPYNFRLFRKKGILHASIIVISLVCFAYPVVKGSFIVYAIQNDEGYVKMHLTYNILAVSAVVFGLLELVASLLSFSAMRKVKVMRILHRLDEDLREVDAEGKPIKRQVSLRRLMGLAKPEAGLLTIATLCLLVSSAAQTAAPLFFGKVVDSAQKSMDELNRTVVILLVIYLIGSIASMFRSTLFTLSGQRLVARLRKDLFHNIIVQEIAFFDVTRTGELTNRLASDTQVIQNAVTVNISMLFRYLLQITGSLALMFVLNPSLTGVLLAVVPIVSLGAVQYGKFVRKLRQEFQDKLADASTTAEESISSIRTVRSFSGEGKNSETYGKDIDESYRVGKRMAVAQGSFDGSVGMVAYGAITLVLWYGGKLVHDGHLSPGVLTSFLLYTLQVAMAFAFISSLYGDFMQAVGASIRIFDLLDRKPTVPNEGGLTMAQLSGSIEFQNVKFTYPSRPDSEVLKDITFTVNPGQMVALVGPSGGGKSTIVSLIERFYDPDGGRILLGGMDLKALDPHWFRTKVSLVGQEPTLFACSIKDNIAYGKEASMEEIEAVAKQANAHDFIMDFEEGYDTLVGERGVRLSGGQKQRVAVARALIMDPLLLLLDEATSALDAESEHLVQEAIDRAMKNRTVLVIAHRLSTVRDASKVVVIEKGRIVEQGSHDQLLAKKGVYKKLVLRQLMAGTPSSKGDAPAAAAAEDEEEEEEAEQNDANSINRDQAVEEDSDPPAARFIVGTVEE